MIDKGLPPFREQSRTADVAGANRNVSDAPSLVRVLLNLLINELLGALAMDEAPDSPSGKTKSLPQKMSKYFQRYRDTSAIDDSVNRGFNNNPSLMKSAGTHLAFDCNGTSFVYAYIRKNACSTFKDFIYATSPHLRESESDSNQLRLLRTHHEIHSVEEFNAANVRIFVYRNPIERATSLFKNKFVMNSGNTDLFHDFERVTGKNPLAATFSEFVNDYLAVGVCALDPHCKTQQSHLLPMHYTHAIPMSGLHTTIAPLIGSQLAQRYFTHHVNASIATPCQKECSDTQASELHRAFANEKRMPTNNALLTAELVSALRRIYRADFRMLSEIEGAR